MFYIILIVALIWVKVAFIRLFMLLDKDDHEDTTSDKIMLFPFTAMSLLVKAISGKGK